MSDRENLEKGDEEAKETDTRRESTSIEETEGRDPDSGPSEYNVRPDLRHERYPRSGAEKRENEPERHGLGEYPVRIGVEDCYYYLKNGFCGYGLSCRFNHPPVSENTKKEYLLCLDSRFSHGLYSLIHRNQMRHGMVQPSPYPGAGDCRQYLQSGQCSYGPKCRFNHPPSPRDLGAIDCRQYLQTGQCSYGPKCRYNHPPSPVLSQWVSRQICKFFQKGNCKYGSGCKFTHSMSGDGAEAEPMRQDTTWGKKRHAAKSSSRPWKRTRVIERQAHDLEEHKQKKRKVENLRIDPNAQSGEGGSQTEQRLEIPENFNVNAQEQADMERQNREAQEKAQEERRLQIDNERRQARLRLERMQPRVLTNNVDQLREALPDIGIERKEGDGF
uniref:C3H1-type domain-containing protein n=1 Tax=Brassica oleracea var. oleracea TaxID=109376 RepID=A0A0D3D605_BRAOL